LQEIRNSKRSAERVAFSRTTEVVSKDPLADQTDDPADEDSCSDKESGSACADLRVPRAFWRCCTDLFESFTGGGSGTIVGDDFDVFFFGSGQRAYSLILLRSVL
jgi:hypothetical protein